MTVTYGDTLANCTGYTVLNKSTIVNYELGWMQKAVFMAIRVLTFAWHE